MKAAALFRLGLSDWRSRRLLDGVAVALGAWLCVSAAATPAQAASPRESEAARLFFAGKYDDALRVYVDLAVATGEPALMCDIGRCYQRLGQWENASKNLGDCLSQAQLAPKRRREMVALKREVDARRTTAAAAGTAGANPPGGPPTMAASPPAPPGYPLPPATNPGAASGRPQAAPAQTGAPGGYAGYPPPPPGQPGYAGPVPPMNAPYGNAAPPPRPPVAGPSGGSPYGGPPGPPPYGQAPPPGYGPPGAGPGRPQAPPATYAGGPPVPPATYAGGAPPSIPGATPPAPPGSATAPPPGYPNPPGAAPFGGPGGSPGAEMNRPGGVATGAPPPLPPPPQSQQSNLAASSFDGGRSSAATNRPDAQVGMGYPAAPSEGGWMRPTAYTVGSIGVVAAVGGLGAGYLSKKKFDEVEREYNEARYKNAKTYNLIQFVGYGIGAVGIGTAIVLLATAPDSSEVAAAPRLQMVASPSSLGLAGTF